MTRKDMRRFSLTFLILCFLSNVAALEISERDADAFLERGILRGASSDLDGAIADFTKAIELNPQNATAHANRGMTMLLQGRDAAAQ